MPSKKKHKKAVGAASKQSKAINTKLKIGDNVMVVSGGNGKKRANVGQIGAIREFLGQHKDKVIVEGVNFVTKNKRQTSMQDKAEQTQIEAPIHISNVMYYVEKIQRPVRLTYQFLEDGKKVRGYINPEDKKFVQVK